MCWASAEVGPEAKTYWLRAGAMGWGGVWGGAKGGEEVLVEAVPWEDDGRGI